MTARIITRIWLTSLTLFVIAVIYSYGVTL